jgi:hypothetical protein
MPVRRQTVKNVNAPCNNSGRPAVLSGFLVQRDNTSDVLVCQLQTTLALEELHKKNSVESSVMFIGLLRMCKVRALAAGEVIRLGWVIVDSGGYSQ